MTNSSEPKLEVINLGVLVRDAEGQRDIVYYDVRCPQGEIEAGAHHDSARAMAEFDGYQVIGTFDENDPAWQQVKGRTDPLDPPLATALPDGEAVAVLVQRHNGDPDFVFYEAGDLDGAGGDRINAAMQRASKGQYSVVHLAFDSTSPAWRVLVAGGERAAVQLTDALDTLRELGFGGDDPIDGGDAVEVVGELYERLSDGLLTAPEARQEGETDDEEAS